MARITRLSIEGYRSINERIEINFPPNQPVVLVGENNAGKSNIVKALQLVLGPFWPGSHEPEDHEFFGRNRSHSIKITIDFDPENLLGNRYQQVIWRYNPAAEEPIYFRGFDPSGNDGAVRNEDRDTCMCVVVEADRNLGYHLSYSSKWTLLSRLMHRFHRELMRHENVRTDLEGLFEEVKEKFHKVSAFQEFVQGLQQELGDLISTMQHQLQVDFEAYNPVNFFHALRLQAVEDGKPRTLEEMGTGEQQILALAFAYAYAKAFHGGLILVIEEPEAHLHPLAQRWLAKRLKSRSEEGLQILLTTHSPAFVSVEDLEGLVLVYKQNGATRVRQLSRQDLVNKCIELGAPPSRVTEENILPFYTANATTDLLSGFFARAVVLVEGTTEALAFPILLAKCGLQVDREGIAVLNVGGKGNLAKWYRLYTAYAIPCYIVFDNDSNDDSRGNKRREALRAVGIHEEEAEDLITADNWIVAPQYTIFGRDFEHTMRRYFNHYEELEEEARALGVNSKPFVARWVTENLDRGSGDEGWAKVEEMVRHLRNLLEQSMDAGTVSLPEVEEMPF